MYGYKLKFGFLSTPASEAMINGMISLFLLFCLRVPAFSDPIDDFSLEIIGGVKQAILIRGENAENPVILRIHGGPGYPYFPYLPLDGKLKDLENHFTMVYWEQRGTGASFSHKVNKSQMNVDRFVEDAHEVIQYIRVKLNVNAVYVWGHSWGSNIGILLAERYPEEIIAYIGTGQSANPLENERSCYAFALERTKEENNLKGIKELQKIDTVKYNLKDALKVRKWLYSYGGIEFAYGEARSYVDEKMLGIIWQTPQYRLRNKLNIIFHPYYSARHLWEDMKEINLFRQAPDINVPVFFLLGRYDRIVSSGIAAEYFEALDAPEGKQLIWFEQSAHRPHAEEPEKFFDLLVNVILPRTADRLQMMILPVAEQE
jgi:pimeloyl-ACP methyl ester carboxylesterase